MTQIINIVRTQIHVISKLPPYDLQIVDMECQGVYTRPQYGVIDIRAFSDPEQAARSHHTQYNFHIKNTE
jgi:hypothetical protein